MWRVALIIGIVLAALVLSAQNMHRTRVNLPFTQGFEIATVFLLVLCFALGYATARLTALVRDSRKRKRERDER